MLLLHFASPPENMMRSRLAMDREVGNKPLPKGILRTSYRLLHENHIRCTRTPLC